MNIHSDEKKEELKRIVIDAISKECKTESAQQHEDLRTISKGLEDGRELELAIITGGKCNYSYKLHFQDDDDTALFVKLTFGSPLLFPDQVITHERTAYEFKMMELFAGISPNPSSTITPYLCIDVDGSEENMKVLVTQFSSRLQEQAANVFVDGGASLEESFSSARLAEALSALHGTKVTDTDFNEDIRDFFLAMVTLPNMLFGAMLDESNQTRPAKLAKEIGKEGLDQIIEVYAEQLKRKDCYIHGDCQVFNMLVEGSTRALTRAEGEPSGDVTFVDWEFSHYGPVGKDLGFACSFPLTCALAHAVNGDSVSSRGILDWLDAVWETYAASIDLGNFDNGLTIEDLYRQVMGFMAVLTCAYSELGLFFEYLPLEPGNDAGREQVKESLRVLTLVAFDTGFGTSAKDATLEELRDRFRTAVRTELDRLAPPAKPSRRRSSLLRATGRRVSDASAYFEMVSEVASEEE